MGDKTARVLETRQRILDILKGRGPSLPVHIAKGTGVSMIFAGAFLSELMADKQVKTSHMRVGGSPLYLLPGQESLLENFYQYLGGKEKETFLFLKDRKVLRDDQLEPAFRVALRSLKDFAEQILVRQKLDGIEKEFIFWRYFLFPEEDAKKAIENVLEPKKEKKEEVRKEELKKEKREDGKSEEWKEEKEIKKKMGKKAKSVLSPTLGQENFLPVQKEIFGSAPLLPEQPEKTAFALSLIDFFKGNNIQLLEEKSFSKKEYEAIVEVETPVGRMKFLATARDKKLVGEEDVIAALQKAQMMRLPALVLAPGKLNKKAQEYVEQWHAFLKFKKMG